MCIDLYVDKILVYTDCAPSPVTIPSVPVFAIPNLSYTSNSNSPSPMPTINISSSYTPNSNSPSPNTTPTVNGIDNHLETPSAMPIMNTTISPSSSNFSNMTEFHDPTSEFIQTVTIVGIVLSIVVPVLILCLLVCRRCRGQTRVQPVQCQKKKKSCCECFNEKPTLKVMRPYVNQPPLPVEDLGEIYEGTPSAPALSLPPTPVNTQTL